MRAAWRTLLGVGWLVLGASVAEAQSTTRTCVEVVTRQTDAVELRRLVMDELDRHKTHRAAEGDCESYLRVEIIALDVGRYVTARMNSEVPHRERVEGEDLAPAISRALRVVLHNDPVRLRGPRQEDVFRASVRALRDGQFLYGAEAFQVVGVVDGEVSSAPGLAFVLRREVLAWHLAARLSFAHRLDGDPEQLALTGHAGLQLQVAWFPWYSGDTSAYVGGLLGVDHVRFEGPAPLLGPRDTATFSKTGFGLGVRTGVEFFRTTTGRLDIFAQAVLPAYAATDEDAGVVDTWVPTFTVGAGMLF